MTSFTGVITNVIEALTTVAPLLFDYVCDDITSFLLKPIIELTVS